MEKEEAPRETAAIRQEATDPSSNTLDEYIQRSRHREHVIMSP